MSADPITITGAVLGLSHLGKSLLEKTFGPAAEEIGEHLKLKVRGYLATNRNTVVNRAAAIAEEMGNAAHEVPFRVLLPLLDGASREDEPTLQEMWAFLLAASATADDVEDVPPSYCGILSQLSPLDARVLVNLWARTTPAPFAQSYAYGAKTSQGAMLVADLLSVTGVNDLHRLAATLDLLCGLGLASALPLLEQGQTWDDQALYNRGVEFRITALGESFLNKCSPGRVNVPPPLGQRPAKE